MVEVVVIGCGVIGLTTAVALREAGLDARIVAAAPPEETTSAVAAAIWYPYKAYRERDVLRWGRYPFGAFERLAGAPGTGVRMREGLELYRRRVPEPWWSAAVPGVRRCEPEELPPDYGDGHLFVVPVVEMPVYLRYLLDRFFLDEDDPEGVTYVVPRSADCVLGGTAEEGAWETDPDPAVAADILRRCAALEPRLAGAEVIEHKVGLRPGRPEVRLEREDKSGIPLVHNYGHGGSGVTLSWGCAGEASALVADALGG